MVVVAEVLLLYECVRDFGLSRKLEGGFFERTQIRREIFIFYYLEPPRIVADCWRTLGANNEPHITALIHPNMIHLNIALDRLKRISQLEAIKRFCFHRKLKILINMISDIQQTGWRALNGWQRCMRGGSS